MKRIIAVLCITLIVFEGCNSKTLDLDKVDFHENPHLERLKISKVEDQKGHWVVNQSGNDVSLSLSGEEKSVGYTLISPEDLTQVNFNNLPLDPIGARLVEYKDKLAFARFSVDKSKTFVLFNYLIRKLGKPDQTFDSLAYNDKNKNVTNLLEANLKAYLIKSKDEYDDEMIAYPYQNVWVKGDLIYQYTLVRTANDTFANVLVIISKDAFNDKIILGYHNPKQDPILSKYAK